MDMYYHRAEVRERVIGLGYTPIPLEVMLGKVEMNDDFDKIIASLSKHRVFENYKPGIFFIDHNGQFHHMSCAITSNIRDEYTYVMIDADCDDRYDNVDIVTDFCNFFSKILKRNEGVKEGIILGGNHDRRDKKVYEVEGLNVRRYNSKVLDDFDPTSIATDKVYLSIDFDFTGLHYVDIKTIVGITKKIIESGKKIIGADFVNLNDVDDDGLTLVLSEICR